MSPSTVASMAKLNPAPSSLLPAPGDQFDAMLEVSGQITEITEFYLALLAVQPALACLSCGGSPAEHATLTHEQSDRVSSDLLLYLLAVAQIDESMHWDPEELFDPARRAEVDQFVAEAGMEPLTAIAELTAAVAATIDCSGAELLADAWSERWPGVLIPGLPCTCAR